MTRLSTTLRRFGIREGAKRAINRREQRPCPGDHRSTQALPLHLCRLQQPQQLHIARSVLETKVSNSDDAPHRDEPLLQWSQRRGLRSEATSGNHSLVGRWRCRLIADRCCLFATRRRSEPRVGRVARRGAGGWASAATTMSRSAWEAISRLRNWDRCSDTVTVIDPDAWFRASRWTIRVRCSSLSAEDSAAIQVSCTRLSDVLTCCPPGPEDLENFHCNSDAGIIRSAATSRSTEQAWHTSLGRHPSPR